MHSLQETFATSEGERSFDDRLQRLFEAGDFDAAEKLLTAELATMDGEIADLCRELSRDAAVLAGWDHLVEAIELQEGDPITGITLAFGNDPDLVFEKGRPQEPLVTIALYTDEAHAFSGAKPADLIAEAGAAEGPAWDGCEEDVELYLEVGGFGPLNTALQVHGERHIFRNADLTPAPTPYIEYVFGCWWRALRFQQAVAAEHARLEVLGGIPLVASTVDMRPELASVHLSRARAGSARRTASADTTAEMRPELASLRLSATPAPRRTGALDMTVELRPLLAGVDLSSTAEAPAAPRIQALSLAPKVELVPAPDAAEVVAEPSVEALDLTAEVEPAPAGADTFEEPQVAAEPIVEVLDLTAEIEPAPAGADTFEEPQVAAEPSVEVLDLTAETESVPVSADTPEATEIPAAPDSETLDLTTEVEPEPVSLDGPEAPEALAEPSALELTVEVEAASPSPDELDTPETLYTVAPDTVVEIEPELAASDAPDPVDVPAASVIEEPDIAELPVADIAPRKPREERPPTGTGLRRRLAEAELVEVPEKRGFLRRLFGRAQSYDEAA